ncbi:MAG: hypothetical protein IJN81_08085 [Clostridia bacterium]|nr:hypothetical protein [Clostridia bacterium]
MFFKEWMKYIRDDVRLIDVVMPGTHNSGSYGMISFACCQDGDLYTQFAYGVRHFCIRYHEIVKNRVVLSHGVAMGKPLTHALKSMRRMLEENDSEFFIFDMREYNPQPVGPITFVSKANEELMAKLLNEHLNADELCFTDYENISEITFEKIRKSGKRFLILNYRDAYPWCRGNYGTDSPWDPALHGKKAPVFAKEVFSHFDKEYNGGLFCFQTQQTPDFDAEVGFVSPRKLDKSLRPYYKGITDKIRDNEAYLKRANVISGDFMTEDYSKCREIIRLNLYKNTVRDECREIFEKELDKAR